MDWVKRITECAEKMEGGKAGFSNLLKLYREAAEHPDELERFAKELGQIVSQEKNPYSPYIVRECLFLAVSINSPALAVRVASPTLDKAIANLKKSGRFDHSDMREDINRALAAYPASSETPGDKQP